MKKLLPLLLAVVFAPFASAQTAQTTVSDIAVTKLQVSSKGMRNLLNCTLTESGKKVSACQLTEGATLEDVMQAWLETSQRNEDAVREEVTACEKRNQALISLSRSSMWFVVEKAGK